jgi:hypothetical protein
VKEHLWSGWRSAKVLAPRRGGPPLKWHLSTRKKNGEMMYLDVCKGAGIARSEITLEAAAVVGLPRNSTCQIQVVGVRAESEFRAQRVGIISYTSTGNTGNGELPSWERPDVLLGMEDAKRLEGYLRAGWCEGQETQGERRDEAVSVRLGNKPASGNAMAAVGGVTKRVGAEPHQAARVLRHQTYADDTTLRSQGAARPNQPEAGERRSEKEKWTYVQRIRTGAGAASTELKVMFDNNTPHTLILHAAAARAALAPVGRAKWVMSPDNGEPEESSCKYSVPLVDWQGNVHTLGARGVDYTIYAKERKVPLTAATVFTEIEGEASRAHQAAGMVDLIVGRQVAPPKGLRQLAGGRQPHADEVRVRSALHCKGDDLDQAQGLAANKPQKGFAAATRLRTNQGSVSPSDGDFLIGPCRLQQPRTTARNRQQEARDPGTQEVIREEDLGPVSNSRGNSRIYPP